MREQTALECQEEGRRQREQSVRVRLLGDHKEVHEEQAEKGPAFFSTLFRFLPL